MYFLSDHSHLVFVFDFFFSWKCSFLAKKVRMFQLREGAQLSMLAGIRIPLGESKVCDSTKPAPGPTHAWGSGFFSNQLQRAKVFLPTEEENLLLLLPPRKPLSRCYAGSCEKKKQIYPERNASSFSPLHAPNTFFYTSEKKNSLAGNEYIFVFSSFGVFVHPSPCEALLTYPPTPNNIL